MKVFISQPMKGKTGEEILQERDRIIDFIKDYSIEEIEIIDSFFKDAPHSANPLLYLSKSLELLSQSDLCVFAKGYEDYRGCRIEKLCCEEYGIDYIEMRY